MADYVSQLLAERSQQNKSNTPQDTGYVSKLLSERQITEQAEPQGSSSYISNLLKEKDSGGTRSAQGDAFFSNLQPRGIQPNKNPAPPLTGMPLAALSGDETATPIQSTAQGGSMDSRGIQGDADPVRSVEQNLRRKRYQDRADYNAAKEAGDAKALEIITLMRRMSMAQREKLYGEVWAR